MFDRALSSCLLALTLTACITTDPPPESEDQASPQEMGSETMEMGTERDIEFAPPDMPAPVEEMDAPIVQDFPTRVTTLGASFDGVLRPRQSIEVTLVASSNDRVTLWLRKQSGSTWNPSVEIFKPGETETWVFGNPRGNEDASIPFRSSQLDEGWRFDDAGEYRMVIANLSAAEAPFRFTLECKSGPCAVDQNDRDGDGVANAQDNCPMLPNPEQMDADGDGDGDLCDEDSGVDAFEGLSDQALKDAIVANHRHVSYSYDDARDQLFELVDNQDGLVECVYTGTRIRTTERPPGDQLNTEHTWPQSRGADVLPARSDLHHLFPTTPGSNTRRSNNYFGEVTSVDWEEGGSELGRNAEGEKRFEPRPSHRGNVARALFYFSVIYGYSIEDFEEQTLRQWHLDDPVDARERERNQRVADVQVSRNPFIDFPQIVERVSDF